MPIYAWRCFGSVFNRTKLIKYVHARIIKWSMCVYVCHLEKNTLNCIIKIGLMYNLYFSTFSGKMHSFSISPIVISAHAGHELIFYICNGNVLFSPCSTKMLKVIESPNILSDLGCRNSKCYCKIYIINRINISCVIKAQWRRMYIFVSRDSII